MYKTKDLRNNREPLLARLQRKVDIENKNLLDNFNKKLKEKKEKKEKYFFDFGEDLIEDEKFVLRKIKDTRLGLRCRRIGR